MNATFCAGAHRISNEWLLSNPLCRSGTNTAFGGLRIYCSTHVSGGTVIFGDVSAEAFENASA